jgi:hypothetical protein
MKSKHKRKVKAAMAAYVENNGDSVESIEYDEGKCFVHKDVKLEVAEQHGGEGEGDEYWVVMKATVGEEVSFWKVPGWYASYHGAELEYDQTFEVEEVDKVIKVWEEK